MDKNIIIIQIVKARNCAKYYTKPLAEKVKALKAKRENQK